MVRTLMGPLVIALVALVLGFALFYSRLHPREIVATGSLRVTISGAQRTLRTRDVRIAGTVFREIELAGGTWIGCDGDCARAVHQAADGFWEKQTREAR